MPAHMITRSARFKTTWGRPHASGGFPWLYGCKSLRNLAGLPGLEPPGPFAPQATNINHSRTILAENTRLTESPFGRQVDAKTRIQAVWTPGRLHARASPVR